MPRGPSRPYPNVSLKEALAVPQGIQQNNAGHPINRILLAQAMNASPASAGFRDLVTGASKFSLVKGNYNSDTLELTPLGRTAVTGGGEERLEALRRAMQSIPLFNRMLAHYNNSRLPTAEILSGALAASPFGVPQAWCKEAARVFVDTGRFVGVVRDVSGSPWVITESGAPADEPGDSQDATAAALDEGQQPYREARDTAAAVQAAPIATNDAPPPGALNAAPHQFFVAYGKDQKALAQLKSILNELEIPFVTAEQEAHAGRPISQKVAELMRSCSAGIFVFSADEEVRNPDGELVARPRPNVVYELGAASFQYGQRIVIFKESGVDFPTDFRDLGYIEYQKDRLMEKSMELLRELVKLKAVRVVPGSNSNGE